VTTFQIVSETVTLIVCHVGILLIDFELYHFTYMQNVFVFTTHTHRDTMTRRQKGVM